MTDYLPLTIDWQRIRYRTMIGVGGIGSGTFFALSGNHTLGREESRSGRFLDRRDYCKLHIITHYVQTLLGPQFRCLPIGMVGDDEPGRRVVAEMRQAGMDLRHVQVVPGEQTMFSICFVYPDGSGGNLTMEDSANARVNPEIVAQAESDFAAGRGQGIALAAPEVSLEARQALLQLATAYGFYRVLAINSAEARLPMVAAMFAQVDLLALNLDEAAALIGLTQPLPAEAIAEQAVRRLSAINPGLCAAITAGKQGSWAWDGASLRYYPALPAQVASTAGAGDAYLAGMIVGRVAGLSLCEAQELATLLAALSVTSPHTIHPGIDRRSLREFAIQTGASLSEPTRRLLNDACGVWKERTV